MRDGEERPIALIGLMGAGKTTVARVLGERLGTSVADLDAMIEAESGHSIAEQFAREGEAVFRHRERELLARVLAQGVGVVACGGGIVMDAAARERLHRQWRVAWLEVSPAAAAARVSGAVATRPMLAGGEPAARLEELLAARRALYAGAAHVRVPTDGRAPEAVADDVLRSLDSLG